MERMRTRRSRVLGSSRGIRAYVAGVLLGAVIGLVAGPVSAAVDAPPPGKSPTIDRIREQKALRAGVGIGLPWLGQNPKTNEYFGPSYELGQRVAKILGVELRPVSSTWDVIIVGLQSNRTDLIIAALLATEKRRQVVDFVNWTEAGSCYAVLKENTKVNTLEDLDQPTVTTGMWKGTGNEQSFVAKYKKAKVDSLVMTVSGANRLEDVVSKRVDAVILDSPRAHLIVHQYPQMKIIPGGPDHCIKNPDNPTPIGMALNYGDAEFKKFLEAVVADAKDDLAKSLLKHSTLEFMLQPK